MDDDFRIGVRAKDVASALEILTQLAKIVEFAVIDDGQRPILVPDRLAAPAKIDDAEASHTHSS